MITRALQVDAWHTYLDDPSVADAILDRVLRNSHKIGLKDESLRDKAEDN